MIESCKAAYRDTKGKHSRCLWLVLGVHGDIHRYTCCPGCHGSSQAGSGLALGAPHERLGGDADADAVNTVWGDGRAGPTRRCRAWACRRPWTETVNSLVDPWAS